MLMFMCCVVPVFTVINYLSKNPAYETLMKVHQYSLCDIDVMRTQNIDSLHSQLIKTKLLSCMSIYNNPGVKGLFSCKPFIFRPRNQRFLQKQLLHPWGVVCMQVNTLVLINCVYHQTKQPPLQCHRGDEQESLGKEQNPVYGFKQAR